MSRKPNSYIPVAKARYSPVTVLCAAAAARIVVLLV